MQKMFLSLILFTLLKNTQVRNSVFNLARTLTDRLNKTFLSPTTYISLTKHLNHTSDKNGDKYISQPYCLIEIS